MLENGLLERLTKKKRDRGLTDAEKYVYKDLMDRGEPDLGVYYPDDPLTRYLVDAYVKFCDKILGINLFHTQKNLSARIIHTLIHNLGRHVTALFSRQCVTGDTQILHTGGRFLQVKDVIEGEIKDVVGVDEQFLQCFPGLVTKWHKNGKQKVYKVRTSSGFEIECTEGHQFFCKKTKIKNVIIGKWARLKSIGVGRDVAVYRNIPVFGDHIESDYKLKALAYFFGAKANYDYRVVSKYRIADIEDVVERFGDFLHKESLNIGILKKGSNTLKWVESQIYYDQFPAWVESLAKPQLRTFLSCFLGHRTKIRRRKNAAGRPNTLLHEKHVILNGDKYLLQQVKLLLLKFSVKSELRSYEKGYYLRINRFEVPRLLAEIGLPGHRELPKLDDDFKVPAYRRDCYFERVIEIEYVGEKETYDLTVDVSATKRRPVGTWDKKKVSTKVFHNLFENGFVCHNSGKTQNLACLMMFLAVILPALAVKDPRFKVFNRGFWSGIYAPILYQATNAHRRVKAVSGDRVIGQMGIHTDASNGREVVYSNGSQVGAYSASDNSNIESASWHMVMLEEAQDISTRMIAKSIIPMLAFYNGSPIFVGTPTDQIGQFYDEIKDNKQFYPEDHLEYDYRHICYVHEPYWKFVLTQIEKYGWDSDWIKMAFRLLWILEHGQFTTITQMTECANKNVDVGQWLKTAYPKFIGIDVAKDPAQTVGTCTAVMPNGDRQVLDWIALPGEDYIVQAQFLSAWISGMKNVKSIYVDSTSKDGDSVTELLVKGLPSYRIVPIKFSPLTKNEMYRCLALAMRGEGEKPNWFYPSGKRTVGSREFRDFYRQMVELQKSYRGGLMVCEKPDKKGAFDDYPDSAALSCYASYQEHSAILSSGGSTKRNPNKQEFTDRKFSNRRFANRRFKNG